MSAPNTVLEESIKDLRVAAQLKEGSDELVISLEGSIDSYNSQALDDILRKLNAAGHKNMVFACAKLNYVSSIGIGVFMNFLSLIKKQNGSLVFAAVPEPVARVFDNLGFTVFFNFRDQI